mgnify:CR=1 FL=1
MLLQIVFIFYFIDHIINLWITNLLFTLYLCPYLLSFRLNPLLQPPLRIALIHRPIFVVLRLSLSFKLIKLVLSLPSLPLLVLLLLQHDLLLNGHNPLLNDFRLLLFLRDIRA